MTTRWVRFVGLALVAGGLGCVPPEDNPSLFIVGNKTLSASCLAEASEQGPFRPWGTLDLVLRREYSFSGVIKNQLPQLLAVQEWTGTDLRVDVHTVRLTSARVTYDIGDDLTLGQVGTFETFTSGTVPTEGVAAVTFPLLSPALSLAIDDAMGPRNADNPEPHATVRARITVIGTTLDGSEIQSAEFLFPLTVCKGCLLNFPPAAADPPHPAPPNCRGVEGIDNLTLPCMVGQDEEVDCRICNMRKPIAERTDCEPL